MKKFLIFSIGTQTPVGRGMKNKSCLSIDEYRIAFRLLKCMIKKYSPLIEIEEWSHKAVTKDCLTAY